MRDLTRRVLYYGTDEPLPEQTALRAGPLSLVFEEGDLRYIRLGTREILRRVYAAVRDRNWGTVPPRLSNLQKDIRSDSFRISYEVENRQGEIAFFWKATITGEADGTVRFTMDGEARATFLRNRIGFCVLHPLRECAGQPCVVEHVDGSVERSDFPRYASPHQPFLEMRAISHEVVPGVWAEVRFEGDIFETEDHRNWTDASYKTYSTPLRLPFPVEVKAGTKISQSITLRLKGSVPEARVESPGGAITLRVDPAATKPLPRIGLGMAPIGSGPLSQKALGRLRALNLAHLRVDLELSPPAYETTLLRAATEAGELRVPLEIALFVSNAAEEELKALRATLDRVKPAVSTWLIFHGAEKSTAEKWVQLARKHLADYDPKARIGAGTNAYFAELNRGPDRIGVGALDLICYSVNPQVHAFDNASLAENLEAQAETLVSARQFAGALPIAVTPITLKPRFNPNATGPEPEPGLGELPSPVDPRQMSLFGAAWTAGSLKYVAQGGAHSVTYYETTGWRGVMETETGSPLPDKFHSLPGGVYPLYHVLADIGEFAGGEVVESTSQAPLKTDGLLLRQDGRVRLLLANLSPETQTVRVTGAGLGDEVRVRQLDETTAEQAMHSPESFRAEPGALHRACGDGLEVSLRPYAYICIDTR